MNPESWQRERGATRPLPVDDVVGHWQTAREQILGADLDLAVRIQTPENRTAAV